MAAGDTIAYVPIVEQDRYEVGYITAPDNTWGNMMIDRINMILKQIVPTDSYFNLFKTLVNDDMIPVLKQEMEQKIVIPARRHPDP